MQKTGEIFLLRTFAGVEKTTITFSRTSWKFSLLLGLKKLGYDRQETEQWVNSLPGDLQAAQKEAALGGCAFAFVFCQIPPFCRFGVLSE